MPVGPADDLEIGIRRLQSEDWRAYREIRLRALATDPMAFEATLLEEQGYPTERWTGRLSSESAATWAAVGPTSQFVGTITAATAGDKVYVLGMWVEPASRRRHLATRLLEAAVSWARDVAPQASVYLDVNPRQDGAVRLYTARGFAPTGRSKLMSHTPGETALEMVLNP